MHSDVETAASGRASEFVQRLGRLKITGCNLLLVGRVPDDVLAAASRKLLGDSDQDRHRLFVSTDSGETIAREQVVVGDQQAQADVPIITYARAAASPASEDSDVHRVVDGDLATLARAVGEEIDAIDATAGGLEPAQLRVCFDSLESLVADHDVREVANFLDEVTERVQGASGMAHYVLPVERDHRLVTQFDSHFDATIEYRTVEDGQERWHFPGGDFTTDWFPLH